MDEFAAAGTTHVTNAFRYFADNATWSCRGRRTKTLLQEIWEVPFFPREASETNPCAIDTDGDGIQDGTERGYTTGHPTDTNTAVFQPDLDPLTQTDPLKTDPSPPRVRALPWLMLLLGE